MKRASFFAALAFALLATPAFPQAKVGGLVQVWYIQMLDHNLRQNSPISVPNKYYNLRGEFQENGFALRRTELKLSGKVVDGVDYEVMIDPSIASGSILQDAVIKYVLPADLGEFKVGQFKSLQTFEGLTSSSELLFAERSQLGRVFGDDRQRGGVFSFPFGDPKELHVTFHLGAFNGAGKGNDTNAQKDFVSRVDLTLNQLHKLGVYTLQGTTDQRDTTGTNLAPVTSAPWPGQKEIYDHKDRTSNLGAYYHYHDDRVIVSAEVISGLLGRRAATLPALKREHLDQKFLGYHLTGGLTFGKHTVLARYDVLNYNAQNDWHTAYNPYRETAPGTPRLVNGASVDYAPVFTEITLGYLYAFQPEKFKTANLKVNYVARSKNFLAPRPDQTGAQGGDTLAVAFQVAF